MSRVINPDSAGKERTRLSKAILIAIRELARKTEPDGEARDLAAFVSLALQTIAEGIDVSVAAWEKRDYWIKADRFRMEWAWAGQLGKKLQKATIDEEWGTWPCSRRKLHKSYKRLKYRKTTGWAHPGRGHTSN
jgi:hypothetical protein